MNRSYKSLKDLIKLQSVTTVTSNTSVIESNGQLSTSIYTTPTNVDDSNNSYMIATFSLVGCLIVVITVFVTWYLFNGKKNALKLTKKVSILFSLTYSKERWFQVFSLIF